MPYLGGAHMFCIGFMGGGYMGMFGCGALRNRDMSISALSVDAPSMIITEERGTDTGRGREWNTIFTCVSTRHTPLHPSPLLSNTYPFRPLYRPSFTITLVPSFSVSFLLRLPCFVDA